MGAVWRYDAGAGAGTAVRARVAAVAAAAAAVVDQDPRFDPMQDGKDESEREKLTLKCRAQVAVARGQGPKEYDEGEGEWRAVGNQGKTDRRRSNRRGVDTDEKGKAQVVEELAWLWLVQLLWESNVARQDTDTLAGGLFLAT
ncbi:uncharacterized protein ColSpa_03519 [Colletotrichum spaethianum]|uniref:Uncharacterized protein n=1 Tax=Colletotrichum spaethianum TaxID=700344 RepID=A0AA37LBN1_9PEZI|nr:uncharacterized protein ColSpa_03519 [Colletotrichum spaethianum]GKT43338.1 hypothetical protein ColSpa_03519 [Colletotrichum spaethianum]